MIIFPQAVYPNCSTVSALLKVVSGGMCRTKQKFFQNVFGMFQHNSFQHADLTTFHILLVGFDQDLISCFTTKLLSGPHARECSYPV